MSNRKLKKSSKKLNKNNLLKGGKPSKNKKKRSSKNNKRSRRIVKRNNKILKGGTSPRERGWENIHSGLDLPSEEQGEEAFIYVYVDDQGRERRVEDDKLLTKVESKESLYERLRPSAERLYESGLVSVRGGPLAKGRRRQTQSELDLESKKGSFKINIKNEDFVHDNKDLKDWLENHKPYFTIAKQILELPIYSIDNIKKTIVHLHTVIENFYNFIREKNMEHIVDINNPPSLIVKANILIAKLREKRLFMEWGKKLKNSL